MPPARKKVCDCGILEDASKEPDHAIRWDERLKEYYIAYGKNGQDGRMAVYYCPFCGGNTPKSLTSRNRRNGASPNCFVVSGSSRMLLRGLVRLMRSEKMPSLCADRVARVSPSGARFFASWFTTTFRQWRTSNS